MLNDMYLHGFYIFQVIITQATGLYCAPK
jgi:hypothetical protein